MGRRKIRRLDYFLPPDEILGFPFLTDHGRIHILGEKQRLGPGSGRAGGARSSTHKKDHVQRGRVYSDTKPEDCPICRFGMKLWRLWEETQGWREGWAEYWEANGCERERREFEQFVEHYEREEATRNWDAQLEEEVPRLEESIS